MKPILETQRTFLRHIGAADAGFIRDLMNEPAYLEFIGDKGVRTDEDARRYIDEKYLPGYVSGLLGMCVVIERAKGEPIGVCGLLKRKQLSHPDVGFAFLAKYQGLGYGFETATASVHYGRDMLRLPRLLGITHPRNTRSINLLERLGMTREGSVAPPDFPSAGELYGMTLSPAAGS